MIGQEAAAVGLVEDPRIAPAGLRQRADVENIDDQKVAGLRALDLDRAEKMVAALQIDVAHVVGAVVVDDLPARPVQAFDDEVRAGPHRGSRRNVGVPAVVGPDVLIFGGLRDIDLNQRIGHGSSPCCGLLEASPVETRSSLRDRRPPYWEIDLRTQGAGAKAPRWQSVGREGRPENSKNELPQPQDEAAFGLVIASAPPTRSSTKLISEPAI